MKSGWLRIYTYAYLVFLYAPVVLLPLFAFNSGTIISFPLQGFTTKWFAELATIPALHSAVKNSLIIGLGSCITYNFINQYHQFLGGNISPGMDMRFRAMHEFTAKLPLVQAEWNIPLLGYDTKTNMQSGVILGMAGEIDGMIERYAARFGNFNVVLTGGNSAYFASLLKNRIFADFNFLFKGLYALSEINQ